MQDAAGVRVPNSVLLRLYYPTDAHHAHSHNAADASAAAARVAAGIPSPPSTASPSKPPPRYRRLPWLPKVRACLPPSIVPTRRVTGAYCPLPSRTQERPRCSVSRLSLSPPLSPALP